MQTSDRSEKDSKGEGESVSVEEASRMIGCNQTWLYRLIRAGRIRVEESGRRGRGKHTMLNRADVEREKETRAKMLEERLRKLKGE